MHDIVFTSIGRIHVLYNEHVYIYRAYYRMLMLVKIRIVNKGNLYIQNYTYIKPKP